MSEALEKALLEVSTLSGIVAFVQDPGAQKRLIALQEAVSGAKEVANTAAANREEAQKLRDESVTKNREAKEIRARSEADSAARLLESTKRLDAASLMRDSTLAAQSALEQGQAQLRLKAEELSSREVVIKEREAVLEAAQKETTTLKADLDRRLGILEVAGAPRK